MTQSRLGNRFIGGKMLAALSLATVLVALPAVAHAGPPLVCHPFQASSADLLPWGEGDSWNSPDPQYNTSRLATDMLRLLSPDAPVLARMENLRRAAVYAVRDARAAEALLEALLARTSANDASALAWFDAGYLVEAYRQSTHMHGRPAPPQDGYAMVTRAIAMSGGSAAMEFAASLMSPGERAREHVRRAKLAAAQEPLLAKNIDSMWP